MEEEVDLVEKDMTDTADFPLINIEKFFAEKKSSAKEFPPSPSPGAARATSGFSVASAGSPEAPKKSSFFSRFTTAKEVDPYRKEGKSNEKAGRVTIHVEEKETKIDLTPGDDMHKRSDHLLFPNN